MLQVRSSTRRSFDVNWLINLLIAVTYILASIFDHHTASALPLTTGQTSTPASKSSSHSQSYQSDFIESDDAFQTLLKELQDQADTVTHPENYVASEEAFLELLDKLKDETDTVRQPDSRSNVDESIEELNEAVDRHDEARVGVPHDRHDHQAMTEAGLEALSEASTEASTETINETSTLDPPGSDSTIAPLVLTDEEFEAILAQLKQESAASVDHPNNYVPDDLDQDGILKLFEMESVECRGYDCPICQSDEVSCPSDLMQTECGHSFHKDCLREYFEICHAGECCGPCPVCRTIIPDDDIF